MLRTEPNAWIHAAATLCVFALAFWLQVGRMKWCLLILAVVSVWVSEAFNTVLEIMADLMMGERYSPMVKRAKDIAAAAVLAACFGAVAIGILVFGPALFAKLGNS